MGIERTDYKYCREVKRQQYKSETTLGESLIELARGIHGKKPGSHARIAFGDRLFGDTSCVSLSLLFVFDRLLPDDLRKA